jgi:hypothetical protein
MIHNIHKPTTKEKKCSEGGLRERERERERNMEVENKEGKKRQ